MAQATTWDIVVVGSANTDYTVRGRQLPKPGETALGDLFQIGQGGKGANQAVAAARLGARVAFVGRIGQDERGDAMLQQLRDEGIDTRGVLRDPDAPTGAALVQVEESGEKQIFMAPNANGRLSAADVRQSGVVQQARVLVIQLEIPLDTVEAATQLAQEVGAKVVLDPAPATDLPEGLLRRVTLVKPNSSEAEKLTGVQVEDRTSAKAAAESLLAKGVEAVAIQAGSEGNLLVWQAGDLWLPHWPVETVDATGAGDALTAALAVALAEGRTWREAGLFASATAALATTQLGAQTALPRRAQVEEFLAKQGSPIDAGASAED